MIAQSSDVVNVDNPLTADTKKDKLVKNTKPIEKSRYFCFLLYPDSSPENFVYELEKLDTPIAISPLHDKDEVIDKETGEVRYKKPHYHVIYVANNNVTADSVRKKVQRRLGTQAVAKVMICDSVGHYYKYLTHESKDAIANKKHVYSRDDIKLLCSFDIDRYTDMSKEAKEDIRNRIVDVIICEGLSNVVELEFFVRDNPSCGFTLRQVRESVYSYSSFYRLYFDAVYQKGKRAAYK